MKTIERAHSPKNMWERVKLSENYSNALEQVDTHLKYVAQFTPFLSSAVTADPPYATGAHVQVLAEVPCAQMQATIDQDYPVPSLPRATHQYTTTRAGPILCVRCSWRQRAYACIAIADRQRRGHVRTRNAWRMDGGWMADGCADGGLASFNSV
jgi:hypothetical protein